MRHSFSDEDIGKTVLTAGGNEVGLITHVDGQEPYIKPSANLQKGVKERLGWVDPEKEAYPLYPVAVASVTDETVTLHPSFSSDSRGQPAPDTDL